MYSVLGTSCCKDVYCCAMCTVSPSERIFTAVRGVQYLLLLVRGCDVYSVLGTSCCKDMYCCAMCTVSPSERILLL